jgi:type II secretory pathway pseudopilin PulG
MRGTRGATLIDTIVGIALMLVVFVGIAAAFQLSIEIVSNNKARISALALAQEQLEYVRSFSYNDLGVVGGIPAGNIPQTEAVSLNGVSYTRRTLIRYIDDPKDGIGGSDANGIIADSKEIKVSVSWNSQNGERTIALTSRASPPGIEQLVPGGTLAISVVDAVLSPVASAQVNIVNTGTNPAINVTSFTDVNGDTVFIGAPEASGYEITVTKSGYSSDQTYTANVSNPNPNPGHLTVLEYQTTSATFSIDFLANKSVYTYTAVNDVAWIDLFDNSSLLSSTTKAVTASGKLRITGPGAQNSPGLAESVTITTTDIQKWKEFSWIDEEPVDTEVLYQILYDSGGGVFVPIPNIDLSGNDVGFTNSPVDLTSLSTTTYSTLRIHSTLISSNQNETPKVDSYTLTYKGGTESLPNIAFSMRGNKTIGTDDSGDPIYKYEQTKTSDALGESVINNMEEDTYTITVDGTAIGYDIAESCEPQPRALVPSGNMTTLLYFAPHTTNSMLVDVRNNTGTLIADAQVRLYRVSSGYDVTQETSGCGQTFFSSLLSGTISGGNAYSIDVTASGYQAYTSSVDVEVSGVSQLSVVLNTI